MHRVGFHLPALEGTEFLLLDSIKHNAVRLKACIKRTLYKTLYKTPILSECCQANITEHEYHNDLHRREHEIKKRTTSIALYTRKITSHFPQKYHCRRLKTLFASQTTRNKVYKKNDKYRQKLHLQNLQTCKNISFKLSKQIPKFTSASCTTQYQSRVILNHIALTPTDVYQNLFCFLSDYKGWYVKRLAVMRAQETEAW